MNSRTAYVEYDERREKIIKAKRWFFPYIIENFHEFIIHGRVLKMQRLSKSRGFQFLLFTYDTNISIFLSIKSKCYKDFEMLVKVGDILILEVKEDIKGLSVIDFYVAAICAINSEDLNFFNHNSNNYKGDALHKRICGSRLEIDSYKTMSIVLESLHSVLQKEKFQQVLTPTLEKQYRGGYARPFISHSNYLRDDIFFRVTAEIYHKQLIVGGLERIYEIVLSFRNESASQNSRNGFNIVEVEAAYTDEHFMFSLLNSFLALSCSKLGITIPLYNTPQSVERLLFELTGKTMENINELLLVEPYSSLGLDAFSIGNYRLANLIFKKFIIPSCTGISIVQDLKENYSPFVLKTKNEVYRWFIIWNGYKIAEVYRSETNASIIRKGIERICNDTNRSLDAYNEYLHSQYSGMPPIATMSIAIERIIMILCGKYDLHKVFE